MGQVSEFVKGAVDTLEIANTLFEMGHDELSENLQIALSKMMNGYHEKLVRMNNRIDSEMSVLEHAQKHMRRVVFPGDIRAEGGNPDHAG